jgi:hypothetical protein
MGIRSALALFTIATEEPLGGDHGGFPLVVPVVPVRYYGVRLALTH